MKKNVFILINFTFVALIFLLISACSQTSTKPTATINDSLPLPWINYKGEEYHYTSYEEEANSQSIITEKKLEYTGTLTKENDGITSGIKIYQSKITGNLYVKQTSNEGEQIWSEFIK